MAAEKEAEPLLDLKPEEEGKILSALAYLPFMFPINSLLALYIIFAKKGGRYARFHALQSLFLFAAYLMLLAPIMILFIYFWQAAFFSFMGNIALGQGTMGIDQGSFDTYVINWGLAFLVGMIGGLMGVAMMVLTTYLAVMSFTGKIVKLPVVGSFAQRYL